MARDFAGFGSPAERRVSWIAEGGMKMMLAAAENKIQLRDGAPHLDATSPPHASKIGFTWESAGEPVT